MKDGRVYQKTGGGPQFGGHGVQRRWSINRQETERHGQGDQVKEDGKGKKERGQPIQGRGAASGHVRG